MANLFAWICFIFCFVFTTTFAFPNNDNRGSEESAMSKNMQPIRYKPLSEFYNLPPDSRMLTLVYNLWIPNSTEIGHVRQKRRSTPDWNVVRWGACGALVGAAVGAGVGGLIGGFVAGPAGFLVGAAKGAKYGAPAGVAAGTAISIAAMMNRRKRSALPIECELMHGLFDVTDVNKDGRLSFDELKGNSPDTLNALMAMDIDKSSYLEASEFNPCLTIAENDNQVRNRVKRVIVEYNGRTIYPGNDGWSSDNNCNQGSTSALSAYYVPSQQVIYV